VLDWLFDYVFSWNVDNLLDDVIVVNWLLYDAFYWSFDNSLDRDFDDFVSWNIDDLLDDVVSVARDVYDFVHFVESDFGLESFGVRISRIKSRKV
jgi:hypothetical protein